VHCHYSAVIELLRPKDIFRERTKSRYVTFNIHLEFRHGRSKVSYIITIPILLFFIKMITSCACVQVSRSSYGKSQLKVILRNSNTNSFSAYKWLPSISVRTVGIVKRSFRFDTDYDFTFFPPSINWESLSLPKPSVLSPNNRHLTNLQLLALLNNIDILCIIQLQFTLSRIISTYLSTLVAFTSSGKPAPIF